tara:strand:- start:3189 stop:4055 length:867 start_codon:yes stop_codon:yes gene_type:complete
MPNLKEVRNRITSVNSTMQITSAMKMVSAAKLKKAQDAIVEMRPYAEKLTEILANLSGNMDASEGNYAEVREVKKVLLVAYTSNRGLCGAFNANIIKRTRKVIENTEAGVEIEVLSVGKKAYDFFKKTPYIASGVREEANHLYDDVTFDNIAGVAEEVMKAFSEGAYDQVLLVYNKFKNAASQDITVEQMLPILPPEEAVTDVDYIFEPSKGEILDELIPKALKTQFYKAILDSNASEHGARMTAMHQATDNAGTLLKELKLSYNKARQAAITTEILEITSGAEALNG